MTAVRRGTIQSVSVWDAVAMGAAIGIPSWVWMGLFLLLDRPYRRADLKSTHGRLRR